MPIYMDRHDISDATKADIAEAHRKDLEIEHRFGLKMLTYWVDEERSSTFCLTRSPNDKALTSLHQAAHGGLPNKIIEVDPNMVEMFLGRIEDPPNPRMDGSDMDSGFRAIMFTDLAGFTALTVQLGDARAMDLLRRHNEIVRGELAQHEGREVKHTGDGMMASFTSASEAVAAAVAIQRRFQAHNYESPQEQLNLRVGATVGEPVEEHGDLFGASVQLASRLCNLAEPGQVLVDDALAGALPSGKIALSDIGTKTPKGFESGVQVYSVDWQP
jgi:class 3 adenylate cyclase